MCIFRVLATAGALFVAASAANAQPAYWLTCQGGPGMKITTNHDVDSAGRPGATAMFVYFQAAPTAARPGPGQCVWLDRTFRPGEPQVLWIKSPNIEFAFQVMGDGTIVRDSGGPRLNVEGTRNSEEARKWDRIVRAVMTGQPFQVKVYNSGNRVMVITDVR